MNQFISTINEIPGILGICIFDQKQELTINNVPDFIPPVVLAEVGHVVAKMYALAQNNVPQISDLSLHYDEISLHIRIATDETILIVGEPQINESLVSLSLNMIEKEYKLAATEPIEDIPTVTMPVQTDIDYVALLAEHLPALKSKLVKAIGPMASIIFDNAYKCWREKQPLNSTGLLEILKDELGSNEQYKKYIIFIEPELEQLKAKEEKHG